GADARVGQPLRPARARALPEQQASGLPRAGRLVSHAAVLPELPPGCRSSRCYRWPTRGSVIMRFFAIAADVAMSIFLSFLMYALVVGVWPALRHPVTAALVAIACVIIVLFRQPNGSLAVQRQER